MPEPIEEAPEAPDDFENIDLSYLKKVSGGNEEFIKDMVNTFIDTLPKSVEEIQGALNSGEWDALARAVHKIKPSLTMVGLSRTREIGALIEENAKEQKQLDLITSTTQQLCAQLELALSQLKAI